MANLRKIDLCVGAPECKSLEKCFAWRERFGRRMVGKYVFTNNKQSELTPAIIELKNFSSESYFSQVKKVHKGASLRQAKKSQREGFVCELFEWSNFIPDIFEINTSKEKRSGGVMSDAYARSIEDLGGPPAEYKPLKQVKCPLHHTYNWGIFKRIEGYKQGNITTDKKLLGYIKFKRNGNLVTYTSILGHGDFLKYGVMYELHFTIMSWVFSQSFELAETVDYILYGAIDSGNEGLQSWKKRCLFEGAPMILEKNSFD